jgi:RHS repeat-associated protein
VIVRDALGHETHTRYNALGHRTVVTDADGGVTHYGYDGLNRLVSIGYPEFTVEYAYDAAGNRTVMTDSVGVTGYVYDDLYRLVSADDPITGTVGYGYDLVGNRTRLVYPTGEVVTYTYDADNRMVEVEDWDEGVTSYEYDAAGRLVATELPNGVVSVSEYNAAGRLVSLAHTAADETLLSGYKYELDNVGNRVQVTETLTETVRVITYTYDLLNRLTSADYSTGESFEYAYDTVGNRTAMTTTASTTLYQYDEADRLTSVDGVTYTWDDRGNLVSDGAFTYTYNTAGRMVQAESVTVTLVYTYTADGLRVAQSVDGDVTSFTWDRASGIPEMLSDGDNLYLVSHGTSGQFANNERIHYLSDAIGSIRQETDDTGAVTNSREWTPFGVEVGTTEAGLGYTGEWFDSYAQIQYTRARWYQPKIGRWTSPDPIVPDFSQPQSINRFTYVRNNAINYIDPTGYWWCIVRPEAQGQVNCLDWVEGALSRLQDWPHPLGNRLVEWFEYLDSRLEFFDLLSPCPGDNSYYPIHSPFGIMIELGDFAASGNFGQYGQTNSKDYIRIYLKDFSTVSDIDVAGFGHEIVHMIQGPGINTAQREATANIVEFELRYNKDLSLDIAHQYVVGLIARDDGTFRRVNPYDLEDLRFFRKAYIGTVQENIPLVPAGTVESGLSQRWLLTQFGYFWLYGQPPPPIPLPPGSENQGLP